MKMIYCLASIFLVSITVLIYSCNKVDPIDNLPPVTGKISVFNQGTMNFRDNSPSHLLVDYQAGVTKFSYEAIQDGSAITSWLTVTNGDQISKTKFIVDTVVQGYKFNFHKNVKDQADAIKSKFNKLDVTEITSLFETFGNYFLNEVREKRSQLTQSIYFHNAALKTVARSLSNSEPCNCTPDPAYYVEKSAFWCQEDYLVTPERFLNKTFGDRLPSTSAETKLYNFLLENKSKPKITVAELYGVTVDKEAFMKKVEYYREYYNSLRQKAPSLATIQQLKKSLFTIKSECMLGTDLGCCGNYEGCCWYSSIYCLTHDIECLCCDPTWYCLPGCKKDSICT